MPGSLAFTLSARPKIIRVAQNKFRGHQKKTVIKINNICMHCFQKEIKINVKVHSKYKILNEDRIIGSGELKLWQSYD